MKRRLVVIGNGMAAVTGNGRLDYTMTLTTTGPVKISAYLSPRNNVRPGAGVHLEILELRNVLRDRIVELPFTLFEQNHHRDAGDRLAHRIDAKDAVRRHRLVGVDVLFADGVEMHDLAVSRDERDDARELSLIHDALHARRHGLQAVRRHADAFRLGCRYIASGVRCRACNECKRNDE